MNSRRKIRVGLAKFLQATVWPALAAGLVLAAAAARVATPSLRAADEKSSPSLIGQTQEEADRKSGGCVSCHTQTDQPTMHATDTVRLGCTDCHGGDANARVAAATAANSAEYAQARR
jgi:mono/diheme cytochrome c family protein